VFATKTELGTEMVTGAITAGVPFSFLAGDEVYGRSSKLRAAYEKDQKGYVLAVPVNFRVTLPSGRKAAVASLTRLVAARCWETRTCGVAGATAITSGRWSRRPRRGTGC